MDKQITISENRLKIVLEVYKKGVLTFEEAKSLLTVDDRPISQINPEWLGHNPLADGLRTRSTVAKQKMPFNYMDPNSASTLISQDTLNKLYEKASEEEIVKQETLFKAMMGLKPSIVADPDAKWDKI